MIGDDGGSVQESSVMTATVDNSTILDGGNIAKISGAASVAHQRYRNGPMSNLSSMQDN